MKMSSPKVIRLNAETFPFQENERQILDSINAEIIEVELPDECIDLAEADAIIIVSAYLKKPLIDKLKKCRIISRMGTGIDKIDIETATQKGILVTNVPAFSTLEVADHTMALLLSAARQLKDYERFMRLGKQPHDMINMHRLSTRTLGLVGFGKIAQAVAKRALAFEMRVITSDPRGAPLDGTFAEVEFCDLDTVLKESDYLSLLCPLMPSTHSMIGANEFAKMKSSAVLINTGRGELVDEDALVKALQQGIISYAAIDVFGQINVFSKGGFETNHALFSLDNVQLTPHVAAYSQEAMEEVQQKAAQAVVDVLSGRQPQNLVNPELIKNKMQEEVI